jgi:Na+-driven multidrug efflux pump
VLLLDAAGMSVNIVLAYGLILGHWGLPAWGIEGAHFDPELFHRLTVTK